MTVLFKNDFLDDFGQWPLAYTPYGGADFGELRAIAATVGDGGVDEYHAAFTGMAGRLAAEADAAQAAGHLASARQAYLRASSYYAASYHPLYGSPSIPVCSTPSTNRSPSSTRAWHSAMSHALRRGSLLTTTPRSPDT